MVKRGIVTFRAIIVTMLFSSAGLLFWLTASYQKTCPATPNEQAGAIYPLDERGRFAYLTLAQHRNVVAAEACFITLWICTGIVEIRNGWLRRARKRSAPVHLK